MTSLIVQTASSALVELLEVSPQVDAAVVFERNGSHLVAHAPSHAEDRTRRFCEIAAQLLDAAERARTELGREPVTQCEVATGDGHVFVVADADHVVAAVTAADPTVGLVFYDLKTALRAVRDASGTGSGAAPATSAPAVEQPAPADVDADSVAEQAGETDATVAGGGPSEHSMGALDDDFDDAPADEAPASTGRFRRRKS